MAKQTKSKRGPGKPKKEICPKDMRRAENYALQGCKNNTICELMNWDHNLIEQRADIKKRLTKKRAERKLKLLKQQNRTAAGDSKASATMQIFLGKNELGQADKNETKLETGEDINGFIGWLKHRES